jgi:hypothetical protein
MSENNSRQYAEGKAVVITSNEWVDSLLMRRIVSGWPPASDLFPTVRTEETEFGLTATPFGRTHLLQRFNLQLKLLG